MPESRNIIFCFDDAVGKYPTNLRKMAETLENFNVPVDGSQTGQVVYYQPDPTQVHQDDIDVKAPIGIIDDRPVPWDPLNVVTDAYFKLGAVYR
jgi:uncharacterized protein (DUF2235 family)